MTRLPNWDFFQTYREFGGLEGISPYILVGTNPRGETVYIRAGKPSKNGRRVWYLTDHNRGPYQTRSRAKGSTPATIEQSFCCDDFQHFNLTTASEEEVTALGYFMCGGRLHGQWFGQLFEQLRVLAQIQQKIQQDLKFFRGRR